MTGNIIVVLAVCGAVFYLFRRWKKTKNSDSPSCGGCDACASNKTHHQKTTLESIQDADKKET